VNVLLVDAVDFPYGGAHSVHCSLLLKGLRENNINASLVIPYGRKREAASANRKKYGHFNGIPYVFVRYSRDIRKSLRFLDIYIGVVHTAFLIYRRKKKGKLDSVILGGIVDILRDFPIIAVCSIFRIPVYFWMVEKASLSGDFRGIVGRLNGWSQRLTEKYLPSFATGMIVISTNLQQHYLKYLPVSKVIISPILVADIEQTAINRQSLEKTRQQIQQSLAGKRLLVYSGSFAEKDGIYFLIDAFDKIIKKFPEIVFVMTGKNTNNDVMEEIKSYIKQKGLDKYIQLVGFVNSSELISYNMLADVLLVCRSSSAFANHGFPWKLGEYCMTERPIVATLVSDIENYFVNDQDLFIVEPDRPDAIADKVIGIFNHYADALEVAKRGKKKALSVFGYFEKARELAAFMEMNNSDKN
jgi:glycosyltransferase involved in cell wall biosynthesis